MSAKERKAAYAAPEVRSLGVEQWRALARAGTRLPVRLTLDGVSMQPLIRKNRDVVIMLPLERPVKRGDIVLFRRGDGRYAAHRVMRAFSGGVQTIGDACRQPDPWMRADEVLGLAVCLRRGRLTLRLDSAFCRAFGRAWMAVRPFRQAAAQMGTLARKAIRRVLK